MDKIIKEYDEQSSNFMKYMAKMKTLIIELLQNDKINFHYVSERMKKKDSLINKINIKGKYNTLNDITDIVGIRIITYFDEDVDKIANIIEKEFDIDEINSVDKREKDYDKFGYLSLHYVVKLKDDRLHLTEYQKFVNMKCEIQIRSILQHAWAEIEHDLGYKGAETIPLFLKRDFSRISALLETADHEFSRLREAIEEYNSNIDSNLLKNPEIFDINNDTLKYFIKESSIIKEIDSCIAEKIGSRINEKYISDISEEISKLKFLNIKNIKEIEELLKIKKEEVINIAFEINKNKDDTYFDSGYFNKGISIFYLEYLILLKNYDNNKLKEYLNKYIYQNPDVDDAVFYNELIKIKQYIM